MDHHVFRVATEQKWPLINQIAAREGRTILFVRTKYGAERLAANLNKAGVSAGALHGGRTQAQRTKALNKFKDGSVSALVATDVAARGIHVDDVSLVLHVDPPADEKDYLHRSGRTARAGESGMVVTIVTPNEERAVRNLMSAAGVRPEQRDAVPGSSEIFELTGARQPSGVPIAEGPKSAYSSPRRDRGRQPQHGRGRYDGGRPEGRFDARPARSGNRSGSAYPSARRTHGS
jgi:superfamily II DNA/RNA helicase